ncbi:hypothetical protein PROFUN_15534 [Planoprotostelium fungivorum]|uniref:Uncharacterized protein n=1 Tax=Planoprotostelium fungivorum TaxID=1890364 RepID=A0A2P6MUQ7_9EUKA|nr:hypothetical protein PROFUN_15534 [Planoprotostelium fungivorum]
MVISPVKRLRAQLFVPRMVSNTKSVPAGKAFTKGKPSRNHSSYRVLQATKMNDALIAGSQLPFIPIRKSSISKQHIGSMVGAYGNRESKKAYNASVKYASVLTFFTAFQFFSYGLGKVAAIPLQENRLHRRFRNQPPIRRKSSASSEIQKSTSDSERMFCNGGSEINLRWTSEEGTSQVHLTWQVRPFTLAFQTFILGLQSQQTTVEGVC